MRAKLPRKWNDLWQLRLMSCRFRQKWLLEDSSDEIRDEDVVASNFVRVKLVMLEFLHLKLKKIRWSADDRFIQGQWPWYTWSVAAGSANSSCHGGGRTPLHHSTGGCALAAWDLDCAASDGETPSLQLSRAMLKWSDELPDAGLDYDKQARRAMFEVVHLLLKTGVDFDKAFISGGATQHAHRSWEEPSWCGPLGAAQADYDTALTCLNHLKAGGKTFPFWSPVVHIFHAHRQQK